jgi:membrane protein
MKLKQQVELVKQTFVEFFKEKSLLHGAALAYYSLLALIPILYLTVTYFGKIVGQEVMLDIISSVLSDGVGLADSSGIINFIDQVNLKSENLFLEIVGIIVLLFSCTVIFNSLKSSLNVFYDIKSDHIGRKKKIIRNIVSRLISMSFILGIVVLLVVLYFAQTIFLSLNAQFFYDSQVLSWFFSGFAKYAVTILTNMIVLSFIFKYLHDGRVAWEIVIKGSLVTSVLLYLGQLLIKFYLAHYFFASSGGKAGAILMLLVWVYCSSQIIFFGAKYIAVLSRMKGTPIEYRD